ncbi:hypothetical protein GCM10009682_00330 [Luedemannella flava]|uniref:Uncharacterized protein n=1 Tax=Luedemannella flava TaxID=349316 RepID=A0ABN2LAU3_9ACTN
MQLELTRTEVAAELDLWLEDDTTAEQLPPIASTAPQWTAGCGGCYGCSGCYGCYSCGYSTTCV